MATEPRSKNLIAQILDSDPAELRAWRNRALPDLSAQTYIEVLVHFEEGDIEQLASATRYISFCGKPAR